MTAHVPADGGRRWVGRPIRRVEDRATLSGRSTYVDDLAPPGVLHAAFLRSAVAAGVIRSLRAGSARALPAVIDVLTADDVRGRALVATLDRPFFKATSMPLLAEDVVRFVGEPVAMVVAESPYPAEDGVEALEADIEATDAVSSLARALEPEAPRVHAELPDNPPHRRHALRRRRRRRGGRRGGRRGRRRHVHLRPPVGRADGGARVHGAVGAAGRSA